jgi:hypothetical protein
MAFAAPSVFVFAPGNLGGSYFGLAGTRRYSAFVRVDINFNNSN